MLRRLRALGLPAILLLVILFALAACNRPARNDDSATVSPVATVAPESLTPAVVPGPDAGPTVGSGEGQPAGGDVPVEGTPPAAVETPAGPEATPAGTGEGSAPTDGGTTTPSGSTYTVQAGDTLGQIAQRFGVSLQELAAANNIVNMDYLEPGQVLVIPVPGAVPDQAGERIHLVQAGDTLFRIGLLYGFTVEELVEYNGLADPNRLEVGQQIRIPPDS